MVWSDDVFADEIQTEWRQALPGIIAGRPDRTDLMVSMERAGNRLPRMREIISAVSHESGVAFLAIIGQCVNAKLANARALVVCLARELRPDLSQTQIATALNKDRAIARNAMRRAEKLKMDDNDFVHWYRKARRRLGYA